MPLISDTIDYNGFAKKSERLGLLAIIDQAVSTITGFQLTVEEKKHANGTRGIRQTIDQRFEQIGGWMKVTSGGIDWTKVNGQGATVGVEVQVSGRSDMLAVDIMHLKEKLVDGVIDVGLIIVPDDVLSRFLTDRTPNLATAIKHINHRASDLPIRVLAFRHDGVGEALVKMRTNLGGGETV
ncbi:hypothetical protein [Mesorhizobium sp.]|uniref:hypothetical protein n=1 Tax=Mesorhizobium sp. TaxID=1871066 RepID=UPI000FEA9787|nr:hypothetical protein [Mesorhizobium sp.]RWA81304.1 MAG: hypothetical protein EOQ30_19195 [Mesorhizobium sp.]